MLRAVITIISPLSLTLLVSAPSWRVESLASQSQSRWELSSDWNSHALPSSIFSDQLLIFPSGMLKLIARERPVPILEATKSGVLYFDRLGVKTHLIVKDSIANVRLSNGQDVGNVSAYTPGCLFALSGTVYDAQMFHSGSELRFETPFAFVANPSEMFDIMQA